MGNLFGSLRERVLRPLRYHLHLQQLIGLLS
jgi:hypothetical protein